MDLLISQLTQLESAQLVRKLNDPELSYLFKHMLTQETVYQSLLQKNRRAIHLRVAQCYERLYADDLDRYAAILSHHYSGAGDSARTFEYALRAGDAAERLYAHTEALAQYALALDALNQLSTTPNVELPERAQVQKLYTNRGRTLELSSRYDLAEQNYLEMESAARARSDRHLELAALILRATLRSTYTPLFNPEEAVQLNPRALTLAQEIGDRAAESKVLWLFLLVNNYGGGDPNHAIEYGERSLALARELNLREQIAYDLNDLGSPYALAGQYEKSRDVTLEAVELWKELGNLPMLADATTNLVSAATFYADLQAALDAGAEGLRLSRLTGSVWGQAYSQMFLGPVLAELGDYGKAIEVDEECLRLAESVNFLPALVATRIDHAWILGNLGQIERALAEGQQAYNLLDQGMAPFAAFVTPLLVRIYLLAGDIATAQRIAAEGPFSLDVDSPWNNSPDSKTFRALARAELAAAQDDYDSALGHLNPMIEYLEQHKGRFYLPDLHYHKALVLRAQGNSDAALAPLEEARRVAEAINSRRMQWQILAALGELHAARGNSESAATLRDEAREVLQYIVDHIPPGELRQSFLSLPQVRSLY